MTPWPLRLAAREGIATARSGRWTSLLVIAAVAWLVAAPGAADAIAVSDLIEDERAWIQAGGFTFAVTGAMHNGQPSPIPVGPCDRLTQIEGIQASFAAHRSPDTATLAHIPGGRMSLIEVSPGAAQFLQVPDATAYLTTTLAERTGTGPGESVRLRLRGYQTATTSDTLTTQVVDTTPIGIEYDGAILVPSLTDGTAEVCFVRTDAAHHDAVEQLLPAVLAHEGRMAVANPRLYTGEFTTDYTTAYQDRPLRWAWAATATLLTLLWALIQWFRRSHTAIYATFGMRTHSRLIMQTTEWAVLAGIGTLWGWAIGVIGATALGALPSTALTTLTHHAALTLLTATSLVVVLGLRPTGSLLNSLKDR